MRYVYQNTPYYVVQYHIIVTYTIISYNCTVKYPVLHKLLMSHEGI